LHYYGELLQKIKQHRPSLHIKGFTAVELEFMIIKAGYNIDDGLKKLKEYGLDSIPGGGAEIFHPEVRKHICDTKASTNQWLTIHEIAHKVGLPSNATILYGHIEKYEHRIHHMQQLRDLQDKTGGFNAFIPLKFKNQNNSMSYIPEVSVIEDMRNYAVSRLFLDNVPHLKAYWVNIGKKNAQMALSFGVDDLDGTIDDTTKIYSMAGSEEEHPRMTVAQMVELIRSSNRIPVERDTIYLVRQVYDK